MKRFSYLRIKKEDIKPLEQISPNVWRAIRVVDSTEDEAGRILAASAKYGHEPTTDEVDADLAAYKVDIDRMALEQAKRQKLMAISEYNTSENVDGFLLNGTRHWLTLEERKSAKLSTDAHITLGHETTEQYLSGVPYTLPCQTLIIMLAQLEVYALDCLNNALRQKAEVEALTTVEEVEAYDVTNGYPEMLNFNI